MIIRLQLRKSFITAIIICAALATCSAQRRTAIVPRISAVSVNEITDAQWKILSYAWEAENWARTSSLATEYISRLAAENDKKQIARLRYIYLYSLAGMVAQRRITAADLEQRGSALVGKEFVIPSRPVLTDCTGTVNSICPVKDNKRAVRITSTTKAATTILSFNYISFDKEPALQPLAGKQAFTGGTLKSMELNPDPAKPWIMRLFFGAGFINVAAEK
jgi:hypothetical protein